jgi:hypothetical protein
MNENNAIQQPHEQDSSAELLAIRAMLNNATAADAANRLASRIGTYYGNSVLGISGRFDPVVQSFVPESPDGLPRYADGSVVNNWDRIRAEIELRTAHQTAFFAPEQALSAYEIDTFLGYVQGHAAALQARYGRLADPGVANIGLINSSAADDPAKDGEFSISDEVLSKELRTLTPGVGPLRIMTRNDFALIAPAFNHAISQAEWQVGTYSIRDARVQKPTVIAIDSGPEAERCPASIEISEGHAPAVVLSISATGWTGRPLGPVVDHELGHTVIGAGTAAGNQELVADRYSADAGGLAAFLLEHVAKINGKAECTSIYASDDHDPHPPIADRIRELLKKMYGNDIFRMSGAFVDGNFHPREVNGKFLTEDNRAIDNWPQLRGAIEALVDRDLTELRKIDNAGVTTADVQRFADRMDAQVSALQQNPALRPHWTTPGAPERIQPPAPEASTAVLHAER